MDLILSKLKTTAGILGLDHFNVSHLYFCLLTTIIVFITELIFVGWSTSSIRKILRFNKSTRTDFFCWLIETFHLYNAISIILSFGVCYFLAGCIQNRVGFNLETKIKDPYLQFGLSFLFSDLVNYVRHYVFHKSGSLWIFHAFHHSATDFNILTRQRSHFFESEISRFFEMIPYVIFNVPVYSFFFVRFITEAHQMILHSAIRSDWGFIGKYILVSPAAHRIHHSANARHFHKNFGATFIFWDRIFGTSSIGEEALELGIPDNTFNKKGFIQDIYTPMLLFKKRMAGHVLALYQKIVRK
jgi:sterol desaturase/sphingolipid hydroxylase (fatty acid hydroxylase superfamily)